MTVTRHGVTAADGAAMTSLRAALAANPIAITRASSPLYGPTRETPPIQVHVGTAEILLDDSLRLGASGRIDVHAWEGMTHGFPSSIGIFEAARSAHDLIAAFLRTQFAT